MARAQSLKLVHSWHIAQHQYLIGAVLIAWATVLSCYLLSDCSCACCEVDVGTCHSAAAGGTASVTSSVTAQQRCCGGSSV
eukprot:10413-Heterococcus_DN1.PRE.1